MGKPNTPQFLLSADDSAQALAIGRTKFYELVGKGVIPKPAHVGSKSVWPVASIELAAQRIAEGAAR